MDKNEKNKPESRAHKLLLGYRLAICQKSVLEGVFGEKNKALSAYNEQICFTEELVCALKGNKRFGDKMYWIIYATYISAGQPSDVGEILDKIAEKYKHIPRRTYFRLRGRAIELMDKRLEEIDGISAETNSMVTVQTT